MRSPLLSASRVFIAHSRESLVATYINNPTSLILFIAGILLSEWMIIIRYRDRWFTERIHPKRACNSHISPSPTALSQFHLFWSVFFLSQNVQIECEIHRNSMTSLCARCPQVAHSASAKAEFIIIFSFSIFTCFFWAWAQQRFRRCFVHSILMHPCHCQTTTIIIGLGFQCNCVSFEVAQINSKEKKNSYLRVLPFKAEKLEKIKLFDRLVAGCW